MYCMYIYAVIQYVDIVKCCEYNYRKLDLLTMYYYNCI